MLGHFPTQLADTDPAALIPWLKDTVLRPEDTLTTDIQVRLRGNILHVLCESTDVGLPRTYVLMRLVRSLMDPEVKARFEAEFPQIYQIYVYSRRALEPKPIWSSPIYLNRLERHLDRLVQSGPGGAKAAEILSNRSVAAGPQALQADEGGANDGAAVNSAATETSSAMGGSHARSREEDSLDAVEVDSEVDSAAPLSTAALKLGNVASSEQLSDIMLARQGDSAAIARYLSETLSALNVGVKVSARVVPGKARRAKSVVGPTPTDLRGDAQRAGDEQGVDEPESSAQSAESSQGSEASQSAETSAQNPETSSGPSSELVSRLWVFCEASYSPDPLLIAEPIAERLRQLHLRQFQDAVITIQVTGEASSDWRLRVDLTPPEEMLREWGRWGDVPALARLANQISKSYGLKLIAEVKKATLHLISYPLTSISSDGRSTSARDAAALKLLDVDALVADVELMLSAIAPQGLHRAMLYGPSTDDISPEWLRGIDLPAAQQPRLSESATQLAAQGNMPALAYCLTRALNPDISDQLATGGIRVQLLRKDKLLHIMADGPICPPKHGIVPLINNTLKQVEVPDLEGIRLYGRRAGQKQPIWTHGIDYTPRQRLVPEAKPEFAASEAYIGELITPVSDESLANEGAEGIEKADLKLGSMLVRAIQFVLVKSQLFAPAEEKERLALPANHAASAGFQAEGGKMALIFGAVGLLLAVQFDFMVGRALRQAASPVTQSAIAAGTGTGTGTGTNPDGVGPDGVGRVKTRNTFNEDLAQLDWGAAQSDGEPSETGWPGEDESSEDWGSEDWGSDELASDEWGDPAGEGGFQDAARNRNRTRFNSRDFTASAIDDDELIYSPQQEYVSTATLLAGSTLPTFRSQQLDEKIALYRRRVAQSGPPDVLVIGSSRALRGVDPAALRQALAQSDHEGLSVFNFGVNGATAQVVDLIVRRLIPPDQLPQMIVWADGARAFNSGRTDVTFNAIALSEGYKQLEEGDSTDGINDLALGSLADQLSVRAKATDRQMSEVFGRISSAYVHRGQIRSALSQGFGTLAPEFSADDESTRAGDTPTEQPTETSLIDFDGFLALSTRFNPATYYQDHARVAGAYDGDYKDFQMEGKQADALNDLLYFTTEKEVPVIFINTPLTDEYLDSRRIKAEEEFLQFMLQKAERSPSMSFRDLGRLWPQRYDYFSDPSHLNRYGAYQVSNRLAQDPLIPWPDPLPSSER